VRAASDAFRGRNADAIRVSAAITPVIRMAVLAGFVATLLYGGLLTLRGELGVGSYSALVYLTQRLLWPLTRLADMTDLYQRAMASVDRVMDLLETPLPRRGAGTPVVAAQAAVSFERVSFAYEGRPAVSEVSLSVQPGQTVALVGGTGGGKSTLLRLLLRFIDPDSGRICFDGVDIATLDPAALRKRIGYVAQEPFLTDGSIAENIAYGETAPDRAAVEAAARAAEAHGFIAALPAGYDSAVGERGAQLSGGQRQRIALARALYREPSLLVLDEATSAVDNETEAAIQRSLARIAHTRSTLVVAHRLSTVRHADAIHVLEGRPPGRERHARAAARARRRLCGAVAPADRRAMRSTFAIVALLAACSPSPARGRRRASARLRMLAAGRRRRAACRYRSGPVRYPMRCPHPPPETSGPPNGGEWWPSANNVSQPTMTRYEPVGRNTGAAVVVFPGGGYRMLAMDLEGTEICDWLSARGITCILLKYRVPGSGPYWDSEHHRRVYPKVQTALQDAQRTLGLGRQHAAEWQVDPHKVGVIGFSAGGHLVAAVSTHFGQRTYPAVDAADALSSRPDFAIAVYPGHLWALEDEDRDTRDATKLSLRPDIRVRADTPPTFLLQAEDDHTDGVTQSLAYYVALQHAGVPTEMHLYAQGGHAFGLRPSKLPIAQWPGSWRPGWLPSA
jgi:ABC-type cobalamin/Fe3+-siderophores transport system ATPase subunit/acetyl esterase/lipase